MGEGMKKLLPDLLIAALALAVVVLILKPKPGPDPAYYISLAKHKAELAAAEDAKAPMEAEIRKLAAENMQLAGKTAEDAHQIQVLMFQAQASGQAAAESAATIARLKEDAKAAIEASPAVKALVDQYDFALAEKTKEILSLRATITTLGVPVDTGKVDGDAEPIMLYPADSTTWKLNRKAENNKTAAGEWKTRALRAEGLLASCESLRETLERQGRFAGMSDKADLVGDVAVSAYSVAAHKDFTPLLITGGKRLLIYAGKKILRIG